MSQLAPLTYSSATPAIPQDLLNAALQTFDDAFAGFSSDGRWLRCGMGHFKIKGNGTEEIIPGNALVAVFLRANPMNHCVWNVRQYAPGQEPEAPDLIWMQRPDYYPEDLPTQFRQKQVMNGAERWGYRIRRRTVWALAQTDASGQIVGVDFENPVVFDIASSSLFGKSLPDAGLYKWNGLASFCKQRSGNGFICSPSMFLTRILQDPNATVLGIVNFQPLCNPHTRQLEYLPGNLIEEALRAAMREDVVQLAEVREKLTLGNGATAAPQQAPVVTPMPQPTVQQPVPPVQQPVQQPAKTLFPEPAAAPVQETTPVNNLIDEAAGMFGVTLAADGENSNTAQAAEMDGNVELQAKKTTDTSVMDLLYDL